MHSFDVDRDGKDEVVIGSAVIDDIGKCLWRMNMGHPDWCYLADIDPARPGLELAYGFEDRQNRNGIFPILKYKAQKIKSLKTLSK